MIRLNHWLDEQGIMKRILATLLFCLSSKSIAQETTTYKIVDSILNRLDHAAEKLNLATKGYKLIINYYFDAAGFSMNSDGTLEVSAIYITKLKTEDAVSSLLAHELIHRARKHYELGIEPLAAEFEADRFGIELMVAAGFNPLAAIVAYRDYVQYYGETTPGIGPHNDEDHPDDKSRIHEMEKVALRMANGKKLISTSLSEEGLEKIKCEVHANMNGNRYEPNSGPCLKL
jgi:hypothetical protein